MTLRIKNESKKEYLLLTLTKIIQDHIAPFDTATEAVTGHINEDEAAATDIEEVHEAGVTLFKKREREIISWC